MTLANLPSFRHLVPENILVLGILALVGLSLARRPASRRLAGAIAFLACLAALAATALTAESQPRVLFHGLLARDLFGDFFKYLGLVTTAFVILVAQRSRDAIDYRNEDREAPEFYALLLSAALAVNLMAAASDLLTAYVGLELVSVMSYILAGFTPGSRRSAEAALKYVVYGGVASGAMLYGMSLLYGLAASTDLATIGRAAATAPALPVLFAAVLCLAGFGFKIAVVPFHMWCPDVYEGAPTPVTAFLSVAPKAGGFALLLRVFGQISGHAQGLADRSPWLLVLLVVAATTMTWGNLAALGQQNLKRLLAYSSIAQAGYVLLGVAAGGVAGQEAVLFYLAVYLFISLAAFTAVAAVADSGGGESVAEYAGLGYRMPLVAFVLSVALFALTGLPPTAGFIGKYYLFAALIERGHNGGGAAFYIVAVAAVLNSVVSLYYYARVLRAMYIDSASATHQTVAVAAVHRVVLVALTVPTILLGVYWSPLRDLVHAAVGTW